MKIFELLVLLDNSEVNAFTRYIANNYNDEKLYFLIREFKELKPDYKMSDEQEEEIKKKVWGTKDVKRRDFSHLVSNLTLILEEYMILLNVRADKIQRNYVLANFYKSRGEMKHYKRTGRDILRKLDKYDIKEGAFFFNQMKIHFDEYFYTTSAKQRLKDFSKKADRLQKSLDEFYLYYKLKIESDFHTFDSYGVNRSTSFLLAELLVEIEKDEHKPLKTSLIEIYLYIIKHFKSVSIEYYITIKDKVFDLLPMMSPIYQRDLMIYLFNYLLSVPRKVFPDKNKHMMELYKKGIEEGYSIENNRLEYQTLLNAIATACQVDELEWAKKVIEAKGKLIDKEVREDTVNTCLAYIAYEEGRYKDVLFHMNTVDLKHYTFGMQGRGIMLKAYYELETMGEPLGDMIYNFFDNYRNAIRRNETYGTVHRQGIANLTKMTKRILENYFTDKYGVEKLIEEVNITKVIFYKSWLLKKLEEQKTQKRRY